jgi:hypothetical protein
MTFRLPGPGLRYRREQPSWAGEQCTGGHAGGLVLVERQCATNSVQLSLVHLWASIKFSRRKLTNHSLLIFPRFLPRSTSLISNYLCEHCALLS